MPVSLEFCTQQIGRMGSLEFAAMLNPRASLEVAKTLRDIADTEDHAEAIVTRYLREGGYRDETGRLIHRVPTPAQLIAFAKPGNVPTTWAPPKREFECDACSDSGYVIIERNGISGAQPCGCRPQPAAPEPPPDRKAAAAKMARADAVMGQHWTERGDR